MTSRMARGEEPAFEQFHRLYFDRLLRYLFVVARGDEEAAREAVQATFLRVVRHIKPFRDEAKFWSWLTVLARSCAVDAARKKKRYWKFLDFFSRQATEAPRVDESDADDLLLHHLKDGLDLLPEADRTVLSRKYLEGNSVVEIAAALGESPKAIESRLTRARRKLKEIILSRLKDENGSR